MTLETAVVDDIADAGNHTAKKPRVRVSRDPNFAPRGLAKAGFELCDLPGVQRCRGGDVSGDDAGMFVNELTVRLGDQRKMIKPPFSRQDVDKPARGLVEPDALCYFP